MNSRTWKLVFVLWALCLFKITSVPTDPDSFELLTAADTLGIAHPPGYAIFSSAGYLFIKIGSLFGLSQALSMALMSWILAFGCLWLFKEILGSSPQAALAALFFFHFQPFLYAGLQIEVYILSLFFLLCLIYILLHKIENRLWQAIFFLIAGSLCIHHTSTLPLVLILCAYAVYLQRKSLWMSFLFFIPSALHLAYLATRGGHLDVFNPWGDLSKPLNLLEHVKATRYFDAYFRWPGMGLLHQHLQLLINLFTSKTFWFFAFLPLVYRLIFDRIQTPLPKNPLLLILLPLAVLLLSLQNLFYQINDIWLYYLLPCSLLFVTLGYITVHTIAVRTAYMFFYPLALTTLYSIFYQPAPTLIEKDISDIYREGAILAQKQSEKPIFFLGADNVYPLLYEKYVTKNLQKSEVIPLSCLNDGSQYDWLKQRMQHTSLIFEGSDPRKSRQLENHPALKKAMLGNPKTAIALAKGLSMNRFIIENYPTSKLMLPANDGTLAMLLKLDQIPLLNRGHWVEITQEGFADNPLFFSVTGYQLPSKEIQTSATISSGTTLILHMLFRPGVENTRVQISGRQQGKPMFEMQSRQSNQSITTNIETKSLVPGPMILEIKSTEKLLGRLDLEIKP